MNATAAMLRAIWCEAVATGSSRAGQRGGDREHADLGGDGGGRGKSELDQPPYRRTGLQRRPLSPRRLSAVALVGVRVAVRCQLADPAASRRSTTTGRPPEDSAHVDARGNVAQAEPATPSAGIPNCPWIRTQLAMPLIRFALTSANITGAT